MSWRRRISAMSRAMSTRFNLRIFSTRSSRSPRANLLTSSIPACSIIAASNCAKEKTGQGPAGLSFLKLQPSGSEFLVRLGGCAVDRILGGFLGIAQRLLAFALYLLDRAFALQAIGAGGFANALLGLADGFVGSALD